MHFRSTKSTDPCLPQHSYQRSLRAWMPLTTTPFTLSGASHLCLYCACSLQHTMMALTRPQDPTDQVRGLFPMLFVISEWMSTAKPA